jgi:hypothetical protein
MLVSHKRYWCSTKCNQIGRSESPRIGDHHASPRHWKAIDSMSISQDMAEGTSFDFRYPETSGETARRPHISHRNYWKPHTIFLGWLNPTMDVILLSYYGIGNNPYAERAGRSGGIVINSIPFKPHSRLIERSRNVQDTPQPLKNPICKHFEKETRSVLLSISNVGSRLIN